MGVAAAVYRSEAEDTSSGGGSAGVLGDDQKVIFFGILSLPSMPEEPIAPSSIDMPHLKPFHFKRLLVSLLAVTSLFIGLGMMPHIGAQEVVEQPELMRRRALLDEAAELMRKGEESMTQRRFEHAMEAFSGVREMLPRAPMTAEMLQNATSRYVDASMAQSELRLQAGDLKGAKELVERVLSNEIAPGHPAATAMLERLNDPVRNNPAMNLQHADAVQRVVDLLTKAEGAIALGRYDLADLNFQEVLRIDPYNVTARRGMQQVIQHKDPKAAFDQTRAELLSEVDREWELPLKDLEKLVEPSGGEKDIADPNVIQVGEKLKRIMIPQIAMEQTTLAEAIDFLRLASLREDNLTLDPQARGVNFSINLGPADSEASKQIMGKHFDLQLRNVPVIQVLKYITELTGTTYRVDDYSVTIVKAGTVDEMIARTYRVPPDFVSNLSGSNTESQSAKDPFGGNEAQPGLLAVRLGVKELLEKKGVSFPEGASASYSPGSGLMQVINTSQNQDIISQLIDLVKDAEPVAVAVQVTILKVQQSDLKELGFDWLLTPFDLDGGNFVGGGTAGSEGGRVAGDFSSTVPLPSDPTARVNGVLTSGLRSGSQVYNGSSIDNLIANPNRDTQRLRSSPGIFSLSGIFSEGQAQLMMRGLDQKKGVDLMATPSLVTRSGQSSKVALAREFIYPTEYDPPEVPGGNVISQVVTPAHPTAFETREIGIFLEVLPVADDQKRYIDITLMPEIVDFDGFVNFGSPISAIVDGLLGSQEAVTLSENQVLMPVFSVKRATTQLTIADGATIAYAGLLSESVVAADDKVPVMGDVPILGRLFQSTAQIPDKTAIVFMVHVELIDPTGRPYRNVVSR